jgi:hypothetical protein
VTVVPRPLARPPRAGVGDHEIPDELKGMLIDDAQLFNDWLQERQDSYNYHRLTAASAARPRTSAYCKRPPNRTGLEANDLPHLQTDTRECQRWRHLM